MKVLVFDTETTGLPLDRNPSIFDTDKWPHIVQLSYILFDTIKNKILVEHDWIIKLPENANMSAESEKMHGISLEKSQIEGVDLDHAFDCFDICAKSADIIVGHNLKFDKNMIMVESIRNWRISVFKNSKKPEYCTMKNGTKICNIITHSKKAPYEPYLKYPTQTELHQKLFNTTPKGTHNSWIDIMICLRCYIYMTEDKDLFMTNNHFNKLFRSCI